MAKKTGGYLEASEWTGLSVNTLYWLVSKKRIPHLRLGSRYVRFTEEELDAWLATHAVETVREEKKPLPKSSDDQAAGAT